MTENSAECSAEEQIPRRVIGRPFPRGVSGNPGGRPRARKTILDAISDEDGERVAQELVRLALHAKHETVRLGACAAVLDRLHGRPMQAVLAAVAEVGAVDPEALKATILRQALALAAAERVPDPSASTTTVVVAPGVPEEPGPVARVASVEVAQVPAATGEVGGGEASR